MNVTDKFDRLTDSGRPIHCGRCCASEDSTLPASVPPISTLYTEQRLPHGCSPTTTTKITAARLAVTVCLLLSSSSQDGRRPGRYRRVSFSSLAWARFLFRKFVVTRLLMSSLHGSVRSAFVAIIVYFTSGQGVPCAASGRSNKSSPGR